MGVRVVFPDMGKDPSVQLIEKTITQNGTYDAITDGANGYSKVNVNVEGGGSSDFSTAEVTIINNLQSSVVDALVPYIVDEEDATAATAVYSVLAGKSATINVCFYKGTATFDIASTNNLNIDSIVVTGDIEYNDELPALIKGNGTITIS